MNLLQNVSLRPERRAVRAGAVLLAALLLGCPGTRPTADGGVPPECEGREGCADGLICTEDGRCAGCDSSGQCLLKEECSPTEQRCVLRAGWGAECANHDACQAGQWCKQGLCVDRSEVSLCPGGDNVECPQGHRCNVVTLVCEEDLGCVENADCSAGEVCNVGSHACVPRCTVDTQSQVCAPGERCVQDRCAQCETDSECGAGLACDAAGKCVAGARCYRDRDCKVPLVCHIPTGTCLPKQPPCTSDDTCLPAERCDVSTGRCVPRTCQPDAYEPNEDRPSAFNVNASRYNDLTLCEGDVDTFSISLARGDQLGINVEADPFAEGTFSTVVQDDTGRTLAAGKLLVSHVASAAATYYIAIRTSDLFQTYDVSFLLSRGTPCDDDGYEPNDVPSQPTAVNAAQSLLAAICPQDQDHFSIPVPSGKGLRVSLTDYAASAGLLRLCLFEGAVQVDCTDEVNPSLELPSAAAQGKTFIARVVGADERSANTYTFKVEFP